MLRSNSFQTHSSLEQLAATLPVALIISDANRNIEVVNPQAETLLGVPGAELVGHSVDRLLLGQLQTRNAEGTHHRRPTRHLRSTRDGKSLTIEVQTSEFSLGQDHFEIHCLVDVASREHAEDLEQRMAALVESADDAIITKSLDGFIRTWNPAAERLLGYAPAEIIGESITRLIPEDRQDEEAMIIGQIQQGKHVSHFETLRLRKDGVAVEVSLMISPILDRRGVVVGASKIMRDLSNRRRTERSFRETQAELEQRNAELDDFVCTAAHDLRAPLLGAGSLLGYILEDDAALSVETRERLGTLQQRLDRMSRLLCDIRDHARLGRTGVTTGEVMRASQLVREIVQGIEVPRRFEVICDPSLDAVSVARTPLERVLESLIVNALGHHDLDAGRVSISVTSQGAFHRFCVEDDGPGVPEEHRESVFKMFQTLPDHDGDSGGMGLAIVHNIVSRMGGTCGVSPAEERGSRFWFEWPRKLDAQSA